MSGRTKLVIISAILVGAMFISAGISMTMLDGEMITIGGFSLPAAAGVLCIPLLALIYTIIRIRTGELGRGAVILLSAVLVLMCFSCFVMIFS